MSKLTYRASYYALYAMFAIILIVLCLFFLGGDATGDAVIAGVDPEMWQPAQTDALLYLMCFVWHCHCSYYTWCNIPIWSSLER